MNLGETIYTLRTQKNLSQGDLAEKLEVSRQSVSKWENNSAVPDLEKIIKLSSVFGVTVDELVKGITQDEKKEEPPAPAQTVVQVIQKERTEPRVLAGIILLSLGGLAAVLLLVFTGLGFIYALPFVLSGVICLLCKKNTGLYCAWAVYLLAAVFFSWGTAANWRYVFQTFQWTYERNYAILLISWIWFAIMVTLVIVSVVRFAQRPVESIKKTVAVLVCSAILLIADAVIGAVRNAHITQILESGQSFVSVSNAAQILLSFMNQIELLAFTTFISQICKLLYSKFHKSRE